MRRLMVLVVAMVLAQPAIAPAFQLVWSPVASATGYDVERSIDNGLTWTILPGVPACTGTPVTCTLTDAAPPQGRPQYRVVSKNAGGRTPSMTFGGICTSCPAPVTPIAPPLAVDSLDVAR